jgi:hypothetical protein
MKISELIAQLEEAKQSIGDADVCMVEPKRDYWGGVIIRDVLDVGEQSVKWSDYHESWSTRPDNTPESDWIADKQIFAIGR